MEATADLTSRPDMKGLGSAGTFGLGAAIVAALGYVVYSVYTDAIAASVQPLALLPFLLLFLALVIALGFEFVNGFHDTANAVATVIYTNSIPRITRSCGPASSISWACCFLRVQLRSASSPCCRSN